MHWHVKTFQELTTNELYELLKLRIDVFVVEQTCYYPDLDDLDRHQETYHLLGYKNDKIIAYLRILPAGTSYPDYISIGRVAIAQSARGTGLGHELIKAGINFCEEALNTSTIKISAQEHLAILYQQHDFEQVSPMYLEDGIPHISMLRKLSK